MAKSGSNRNLELFQDGDAVEDRNTRLLTEASADVANVTGEIWLHFQPSERRCDLVDCELLLEVSISGFVAATCSLRPKTDKISRTDITNRAETTLP